MKVFITNMADYNNGILRGKWINPADFADDDWKDALHEIGVADFNALGEDAEDGGKITSEEWFVSDYEESPISDEYVSAEELTGWARLCDGYGLGLVDAIKEEYSDSLEDVTRILENGDYHLYYDVCDDKSLGYAIAEECYSDMLNSDNILAKYFNYEAFGRDCRLESCGSFVTINGKDCYLGIIS